MDRWQRLILVVIIWTISFVTAAGPYEDCILQNMKGVQATNAANAIARACKEKTTPKKCRDAAIMERFVPIAEDNKTPPSRTWAAFDDFMKAECLKECAEANYWSRTFGECRTD